MATRTLSKALEKIERACWLLEEADHLLAGQCDEEHARKLREAKHDVMGALRTLESGRAR